MGLSNCTLDVLAVHLAPLDWFHIALRVSVGRFDVSMSNRVDFRSLFIKTIRVYRIFNAKKLLIKAWTNNDLVKALAVFLSIDAVCRI